MKLKHIGPNQMELCIGKHVILFSYETPVAVKIGDKFYRTETIHSKTTTKHINQWLNGNPASFLSQNWFDRGCGFLRNP